MAYTQRLGEETRDESATPKMSLFEKLRMFLNKDKEQTPDIEEKPQMTADEVNAMLTQKPHLVNKQMLDAVDDPTLKAKIMAVLRNQKQQPQAPINTTVDNEGGTMDAYMK